MQNKMQNKIKNKMKNNLILLYFLLSLFSPIHKIYSSEAHTQDPLLSEIQSHIQSLSEDSEEKKVFHKCF